MSPAPAPATLLVAVLDNEALQAIVHPDHSKHRAAMALVSAIVGRNTRRPGKALLMTTTAVRVEAMVDRRSPGSALVGALRVRDVALDSRRADACAELHASAGGSPVDVTVAQAAAEAAESGGRVSLFTSDVPDLVRLVAAVSERVAVRRV